MNLISVEELKSRIDDGENIHLLDVREDFERAEFNIGGEHIPLAQLQNGQTDNIEKWKNEEIVIYCRSGNRSGKAALYLESLGFTNTANLTGGMLDWQNKNL